VSYRADCRGTSDDEANFDRYYADTYADQSQERKELMPSMIEQTEKLLGKQLLSPQVEVARINAMICFWSGTFEDPTATEEEKLSATIHINRLEQMRDQARRET
jgi:hypothetical protein